MGLRIQERGEVVKGVPVVQPGDHLFWFNRPRLVLYLINFVLFQNAFQLAFFVWTWYQFGLRSCFHEHVEDIVIRISMGVLIQILCSYVTLPLYALVTQMGSTMKPTIFNERVATALKNWHHTAKKHIKESKHSTPTSSRPATPSHGVSPLNLLRHYQSEMDNSPRLSPRKLNYNVDHWDIDQGSPSTTSFHRRDGSASTLHHNIELGHMEHEMEHSQREASSSEVLPLPREQHEINVRGPRPRDFSFDKRGSI